MNITLRGMMPNWRRELNRHVIDELVEASRAGATDLFRWIGPGLVDRIWEAHWQLVETRLT
jgi:hypothetical protein